MAREHGLAARVWLEPGRRTARGRGLPVVEHDFLDSFTLPLAGKAERYVQALRSLPTGLSEWAVHPAVGEETAAAANLGWAVRRSDHAFLSSRLARRVIDEEDIVVIDYGACSVSGRLCRHLKDREVQVPSRLRHRLSERRGFRRYLVR